MMTRRIQVFGLLLIFALSACTFKSNSEPPNTLHVAALAAIKSLDPAFTDDEYSSNEVGRVFEGLLQYHYLKRPYVLIPNLAESMPEISADGRTLVFHLKKSVLFQDDPAFTASGGKGREMTAEDFLYSFKRLADPKLQSAGWWIFDGKVVGLNEWRDAAAKVGTTDYAAEIDGLRATDRYTVQIKLIKKSAQFLYLLAMPYASVVAREAVEHYGKEFLNHPVGTGPFRLESFNPASKIVWVRNPTYRKELYPSEGEAGDFERGLLADAGKPLPLADRIVSDVIVESQPRWLNFLAGKLDYSDIPKDNYQQAITPSKELGAELKKKGIGLQKAPKIDIVYESFNMSDPLLGKNKFLRQAISLAFSSETFIDLFYNGRALPAEGPIPPGLSGFDPKMLNPYREFNMAKAKDLMAKAGYPNGEGLPPIEYASNSGTTERQIAEFTERSLKAIGVNLVVRAYSWPEFNQTVNRRKAQMYGQAWDGDYPDAENFLQLFYSKNVSPGPNHTIYVNPAYDKLYDQALQMNDSPERTAVYKQMVDILVEDCPWIFNAHRIAFSLTQPWLKNFKIHEFDHSKSKYYRVDSATKSISR